MPPRPVARSLALAGLLLTSACTAPAPDRGAPGGASPASASDAEGPLTVDPAQLPGPTAWRGVLPCADCAGIRTTVTLAPDGTYEREAAYQGTEGAGDTIAVDLGFWQWDAAGRRIRLVGSGEAPAWFAVTTDGRLRQLDLEGAPIESALPYTLDPLPTIERSRHPARLVAAFRYLADAAEATECRSGLSLPVAMVTDAYRELEREYTARRLRGAPLIVPLRAHREEQPVGDGDALQPAWVIDSVGAIREEDGCAALRQQDAIAAGPWQLVAIDVDTTALTVPAGVLADMTWDRTEGRFGGSSGCNRYTASGTLRGARLAVGPAMGTKRACVDPVATRLEMRFLDLLGRSPWLRLEEDTLRWMDGPRPVAWFVRRTAPSPD